MDNLILSPKQMSMVAKNCEIVGGGTYGIIYKLDDDKLIKFNYKDFMEDYAIVDGEHQLNALGDISSTIEEIKETQIETLESKLLKELLVKNKRYSELSTKIRDYMRNETIIPATLWKELHNIVRHCKEDNKDKFEALKNEYPDNVKYVINAINKQNRIEHTNLPKGLVFVDGVCVGYVLKNNKNMVNLFDFMADNKLSEDSKRIILNNIYIAATELISNGIFLNDLTVRNIMLNIETLDIQIIDTDDLVCLTEKEMNDESNKKWIAYKAKDANAQLRAIDNYLFAKENESFK